MNDVLAAPTWQNLLAFLPQRMSVIAPIGLLLAVLYLAGAVRLWSRGRRWPVLRTVSFLLGCTVLVLTGTMGVNAYAGELVGALVFQQITLMTLVPPLLITGSPGHLLLRSTPHRGLGRIVLRVAHAGLASPVMRAVLHPIVAIAVPAALFLGLYLTDLVSVVIRLPFGHELLLLVFLAGGIIAGVPLWSSDPLPRAPSYPARLAEVGVGLQIHAVFGLVLLLSTQPLFSAFADPPWGVDPVYDQSIAGVLAWTYAELPLLIVLIVTLSRWRTRDLRQAKIRQSRDDDDLDRYNEYLASLTARDEKRG